MSITVRRVAALICLCGLLVTTRSGSADPADVSRLHWVFDGAVQAAARVGDVLYVGGTFRGVAPSANVVPPVYALAAGSGALAGPSFPIASGQVSAVIPDGSGGYYVAGEFTLTGASTQSRVAHVLSNGTPDPVFTPAVEGTVAGMARLGSTLYLVGSFAVPAPRFAASVIAISAVDGSTLPWVSGLGPMVAQAVVAGDDRLVVIGSFSEPGVTSGVVEALDAATGAQLWRTVIAPGGVGAANAKGAWAGVRHGARVLIAHSPTAVNGGLSSVSLATGAADPSWNPQVSPESLAISGGVLYVGGFFSTIAGQPRGSLAAIDLATATLLPWNPGPTAPILRMAPSNTGGVFVSGLFETIGAGAQPRWRMAEIDAAGAVTPWVAATRPDQVSLFAAGDAGSLIVVSSLTATGHVPRSRLAAFDLTTGALLPWAPSADDVVNVLGAVAGRVTIGGRFRSVNGQPTAGGAALDAATGAVLPLSLPVVFPSPSVGARFADGEWFYWSWQVPTGLLFTSRFSLATGSEDRSWRLDGWSPAVWAVDGDMLYLGASLGVAAIDRRTARVRWSTPGPAVAALAVSGDTVFAFGFTALTTYDARSGAPIATMPALSPTSATVADGRLLVSEALPPTFAPNRGLVARRFDGAVANWTPRVTPELIGGPSEMLVTLGDVVVAGGIFGARSPDALLGLAVFDRRPSPSPANLRARPAGPATEFTWDPPAQTPAGGYVLEAGQGPGLVTATIPLGAVTHYATVVPPGSYYVRVRTAGAAGGVEEVSNEILVTGGCTAPPASPTRFRAALQGAALDSATFAWDAPDALVSTYTLVAGSAPGRDDIASIPFNGRTTGFSYASAIPPGTYYVRVRASNACGTSPDSAELRLTIGAGDLPLAPLGLTTSSAGGVTTLSWTPVPGVTGYVLEAGSDIGLSDLAVVPLGPSPTFAVPPVPAGVYLLRVRAVNAAGTSGPSNEFVLRVNAPVRGT